MILTVWVIFLIIAALLIFGGYAQNMDALRICGYTMFFLVGMVFLTNNLEVPNGYEINNTNLTPTYTVYENHTLAFMLVISSIIGFIFVMVDRRRED